MTHRQSGQALIIILAAITLLGGGSALVAAQFLTGKSAADLRKQSLAMTQGTVDREKIEEVFKHWEKEVKGVDEGRAKNQKTLRAIIQNHDAKPADVEAVYAEVDAVDARGLHIGLDMRFALRELLTEEQWRTLFAQSK